MPKQLNTFVLDTAINVIRVHYQIIAALDLYNKNYDERFSG